MKKLMLSSFAALALVAAPLFANTPKTDAGHTTEEHSEVTTEKNADGSVTTKKSKKQKKEKTEEHSHE